MTNAVEREIRALVRELLRDIVPQSAMASRSESRTVGVANSADLTAFATLVLDLARDPGAERDIRSGRLRFEPAAPGAARPVCAPVPSAPVVAPVLRIDKGAVTEKIVARAAASGTRLVLGRRAVITPLAQEAARKNGVGIERSA